MRILVTGGAGYIGSHTMLDLLAAGHEVVAIDNFSNASPLVVDRLRQLSNRDVEIAAADVLDQSALDKVFGRFKPQSVIHFAGLKAVGESVARPVRYYSQNIAGTVSLLQAMAEHDCPSIVFSSSATVYGDPQALPITESHPCNPANPYGRTKYFIEELLRDWCAAAPQHTAIALRYFNPVGAHDSGRLGENPQGTPNNLLPFISQVAVGRLEYLNIFGDDYDTPDGTGIRDYLHVADLARAHVAAVEKLEHLEGFAPINLGTGTGISVLEMVAAFERASGKSIPHKMAPRRDGDVAAVWADPTKAGELLEWRAELGVDDMCRSAWEWQRRNPNGYE